MTAAQKNVVNLASTHHYSPPLKMSVQRPVVGYPPRFSAKTSSRNVSIDRDIEELERDLRNARKLFFKLTKGMQLVSERMEPAFQQLNQAIRNVRQNVGEARADMERQIAQLPSHPFYMAVVGGICLLLWILIAYLAHRIRRSIRDQFPGYHADNNVSMNVDEDFHRVVAARGPPVKSVDVEERLVTTADERDELLGAKRETDGRRKFVQKRTGRMDNSSS